MSDLNATPGPWDWYTSNSYRRLGTASGYKEIVYAAKYRDGVCGIELRNPSDAHLIAAAPDLYAALDDLVERCQWEISDPQDVSELEGARRALAKARGEKE